ncbi:hypothetical protein [Streptomyces fodineus]|nr:hypothetical protein [Streptomyces fodineus]
MKLGGPCGVTSLSQDETGLLDLGGAPDHRDTVLTEEERAAGDP